MVLAFDRYLAVARPIAQRNRSIGSSEGKRVLKYVSPVIVFSLIYCMPVFFSVTIQPHTFVTNTSSLSTNASSNFTSTLQMNVENITKNCLWPTKLRLSKEFILWYNNVTNFVVTGAIPFLSLAFFNCKIYLLIQSSLKEREHLDIVRTIGNRNVNQQKQQKSEELRQAIVLFGIVIAFFVCHVLRIVLNIEEIITYEDWIQTEERSNKAGKRCGGVQFWTMITTDVSHLLLQVNASINFFIYCFFSKQFKKVLKAKSCRFAKCCRLNNIRWGSDTSIESRRTSFSRINTINTTAGYKPTRKTSEDTMTPKSDNKSQDNVKNVNFCQGRQKIIRKELIEMQSFG